ncbi:hypothetical protein F5B22DRAFT_525116 [Xylaria bambusicola]|uniref:uncharacterized protein n=1 Tax=Xylaria bambusicola TaxID=326684 RepID=UPI002007BCB3|nr:uncharacterized protein F5B22DRAFT_525116 [Xylaria bambusicola]KAI0505462.1 hypothetical protein F5B22DRAFT_525116 [Xylaria bambusicola]
MTLVVRIALLYLGLALYLTKCAANLPPGVSGPRWPSFFEAPEFHLNIAKKDIEAALKPKEDAPGPRWPTIFEAPEFHLGIAMKDTASAGRAIARGAGEWAAQARENLQRNPVETILAAVWDVTRIGVVVVPGLLWGPVLNFLGFGAAGIGQGTAAAAAQSILGPIAPGSLFAFLQSAGAGGYGVVAMDALTRGVLVLKELFGL